MARRFNVPVSLDAAAPARASVAYALTTAGSGGTAGAASDLSAGFASGRVAIAQGQTTAALLLGIADAAVAGHLIDITLSDPLPAGSTIKAGAGTSRLTIPAASSGGTPGMLLVGDVADSTAMRYLTTRPLRAQALFRDGVVDTRGVDFYVGWTDDATGIRFRVVINQDGSFAKLICHNIANGSQNDTGFMNVDLPVSATNIVVGVQINADASVSVVQIANGGAGATTTLFTINAATVGQNFPQPWGNGVRVVRQSGPTLKQVSTGTPS